MIQLLHSILAVMYREYKIRTTSMTWILFDLAVPMFYLLVFGIGFNNAFTGGVIVEAVTVDYNSFFLAGVLSMTGFGIAINSSYGFFMDRDNGIFYEILSYPMTRGEFLIGKIIFNGCITTLQAALTIFIGVLVLRIEIVYAYLPLLLFANLYSAAGWFFFLSIFALRIRRNDFYNTIINLLYFILMFASSLFFPLDSSPLWLKIIAYGNPLTWNTDVLRYLSIGIGNPSHIFFEMIGYVIFSIGAFIAGIHALKHSA